MSGAPEPDQVDALAAADLPPGERIRRAAVLLAGLAQSGLAFTADDPAKDYDTSRYTLMRQLAAEVLAAQSGADRDELLVELGRDSGYATPKVDVRAAVLDERERFLLMRERSDGRWSLPGGWADPGDRPGQAAEREVLEETGHPVRAVKLVAVWDRDARGHTPPLPVAVHKLFFLCERTGEPRAPQTLETLDVGWFGIDELPPLSLGRVLPSELEVLLAHHRDRSLPTEWD
ncbi:NUDIX hydrolase [Kineococcus glutinatus]|uniref:NUDIX hydrolase n=1 Tax=Kineococcus glutinatus TaxID=1070872 RepID=A0ABP8VCM5_9ACTN